MASARDHQAKCIKDTTDRTAAAPPTPFASRRVPDASCKIIPFCPHSASTRSALWTPDRYVPTDRKHPRGAARIRDSLQAPTKIESHLAIALSPATKHFSLTLCAKSRRGLFKFAVLAGDGLNSTNVEQGPYWGWPKNRNNPVDHRGSITRSHGFRDSQCILRSNEVVHSSLNIRRKPSVA